MMSILVMSRISHPKRTKKTKGILPLFWGHTEPIMEWNVIFWPPSLSYILQSTKDIKLFC